MLTKLLKHEIDLIIKQNEFLAEHTIKNKNNYCSNISMVTIFTNMENSKTNQPQKFVLNLPQKIDLRN